LRTMDFKSIAYDQDFATPPHHQFDQRLGYRHPPGGVQ
jgi:hypothetical protein